MSEVVIVGGGASGLAAGIAAAQAGASVTILEMEKKPAAKLLRTGNGRCNYTNTGESRRCYHGADPEFAAAVLQRFSSEDTIAFFLGLGILPYRMGTWIYPHSETASSVAEALLRRTRELGVKLKYSERAVRLEQTDDGFVVHTKTWHYRADRVILSCGTNASMKAECCSGLEELPKGLRCVPYEPALCALKTSEEGFLKWAGVRVHAGAVLLLDGEEIHREDGQIQFTKDGLSGIAIFNMSSLAREGLKRGQRAEIVLDLAPDYEREDLAAYLGQRLDRFGGMHRIEELLLGILPEKLIPFLGKRLKGTDAVAIADVIKCCPVAVSGLSKMEAAQVAAGGILTDQIDPKTMMVRSIPGLYVTGEMLDIDGACGGWNLQFAWASGYLAGSDAGTE